MPCHKARRLSLFSRLRIPRIFQLVAFLVYVNIMLRCTYRENRTPKRTNNLLDFYIRSCQFQLGKEGSNSNCVFVSCPDHLFFSDSIINPFVTPFNFVHWMRIDMKHTGRDGSLTGVVGCCAHLHLSGPLQPGVHLPGVGLYLWRTYGAEKVRNRSRSLNADGCRIEI